MRFESKTHPIHAAIKNVAVANKSIPDITALATKAIQREANKEIDAALWKISDDKSLDDALYRSTQIANAIIEIKALAKAKIKEIYEEGQHEEYNDETQTYAPVIPFSYKLGRFDDVVNLDAIAESIAHGFASGPLMKGMNAAGVKTDIKAIQDNKDAKDDKSAAFAELQAALASVTAENLNALDQNKWKSRTSGRDGHTPLVLAAHLNQLDVVLLLLDQKGIQVNKRATVREFKTIDWSMNPEARRNAFPDCYHLNVAAIRCAAKNKNPKMVAALLNAYLDPSKMSIEAGSAVDCIEELIHADGDYPHTRQGLWVQQLLNFPAFWQLIQDQSINDQSEKQQIGERLRLLEKIRRYLKLPQYIMDQRYSTAIHQAQTAVDKLLRLYFQISYLNAFKMLTENEEFRYIEEFRYVGDRDKIDSKIFTLVHPNSLLLGLVKDKDGRGVFTSSTLNKLLELHGVKKRYASTATDAKDSKSGDVKQSQNMASDAFDINYQDSRGNTALHSAWEAHYIPLLVEYGANVEAKNNDQETPLLVVIKKIVGPRKASASLDNWAHTDYLEPDYVEIAWRLINFKADVNVQDEKGNTCLDIITLNYPRSEVIPLLKAAGARHSEAFELYLELREVKASSDQSMAQSKVIANVIKIKPILNKIFSKHFYGIFFLGERKAQAIILHLLPIIQQIADENTRKVLLMKLMTVAPQAQRWNFVCFDPGKAGLLKGYDDYSDIIDLAIYLNSSCDRVKTNPERLQKEIKLFIDLKKLKDVKELDPLKILEVFQNLDNYQTFSVFFARIATGLEKLFSQKNALQKFHDSWQRFDDFEKQYPHYFKALNRFLALHFAGSIMQQMRYSGSPLMDATAGSSAAAGAVGAAADSKSDQGAQATNPTTVAVRQ